MRYHGMRVRCSPAEPSAITCCGRLTLRGLGAKQFDAVIDHTGRRQAARRTAGGYSLGMRQRLVTLSKYFD
jgi:hypothetical protein